MGRAATSPPLKHSVACYSRFLYERLKTAVIGKPVLGRRSRTRGDSEADHIIYNRTLLDFARHYGLMRKACRPYRATTKGKSLPSGFTGSSRGMRAISIAVRTSMEIASLRSQ